MCGLFGGSKHSASKQLRLIPTPAGDGDQFNGVSGFVIFEEQRMISFDEHVKAGPDIRAQRAKFPMRYSARFGVARPQRRAL